MKPATRTLLSNHNCNSKVYTYKVNKTFSMRGQYIFFLNKRERKAHTLIILRKKHILWTPRLLIYVIFVLYGIFSLSVLNNHVNLVFGMNLIPFSQRKSISTEISCSISLYIHICIYLYIYI